MNCSIKNSSRLTRHMWVHQLTTPFWEHTWSGLGWQLLAKFRILFRKFNTDLNYQSSKVIKAKFSRFEHFWRFRCCSLLNVTYFKSKLFQTSCYPTAITYTVWLEDSETSSIKGKVKILCVQSLTLVMSTKIKYCKNNW